MKTMRVLIIAILSVLFFLQSYYKPPYIQSYAGTLPVVISASHGGSIKPFNTEIRDCDRCNIKSDLHTIKLSKRLRYELYKLTGKYPSLVINNIHRSRLDLNRELEEAVGNNKKLTKYWFRFHKKINKYLRKSIEREGFVLYLDVHGHVGDKLLLGYNVPVNKLKTNRRNHSFSNTKLDSISLEELILGPNALGSYCESNDISTYPSNITRTYDKRYFDGGYNTERYLAKKDVIAIQLECSKRQRKSKIFTKNLATSIDSFLKYLYTEYN